MVSLVITDRLSHIWLSGHPWSKPHASFITTQLPTSPPRWCHSVTTSRKGTDGSGCATQLKPLSSLKHLHLGLSQSCLGCPSIDLRREADEWMRKRRSLCRRILHSPRMNPSYMISTLITCMHHNHPSTVTLLFLVTLLTSSVKT